MSIPISASLRERWFDELEALGLDDPLAQDIPEKFKTEAWYRDFWQSSQLLWAPGSHGWIRPFAGIGWHPRPGPMQPFVAGAWNSGVGIQLRMLVGSTY